MTKTLLKLYKELEELNLSPDYMVSFSYNSDRNALIFRVSHLKSPFVQCWAISEKEMEHALCDYMNNKILSMVDWIEEQIGRTNNVDLAAESTKEV